METASALLGILATLPRAKTEETLISELAQEIHNATKADTCDILFREPGDGLVQRASTLSPELNRRLRLGKGIGLCGKALVTNTPIFIAKDAAKDPDFAAYPGTEERQHSSMVVLPMKGNGDALLGVMLISRNNP